MMFFRRGRSGAIFVATIANKAAPTVAELNAGTQLSKAVATINGFETALNRINQGVMAYSEELQIDGPQTFADASIVFIEDDGTGSDGDSTARVAARTSQAEGATGHIVLSPTKTGTLTAADKCEVWPVKIGAVNRSWSLDNEPARYTSQYAITGTPSKAAVVVV